MKHRTSSRRRGNAIVLAASILVLLVIIATTFISRTQTARRTASAVQRDAAAESSFDGISESIATVVSDALFVRLIDAHYDPLEVEDRPEATFAVPRRDWTRTALSNDPQVQDGLAPLSQQVIPEVRGVIRPLPTELQSGSGPALPRLAIPSLNQGLRELSDSNRPRIPAAQAGPGSAFGTLLSRFQIDSAASWTFPTRQLFEDIAPGPDEPTVTANTPFTPQMDPAIYNLRLGRAGSWMKRYGVDPRFPANYAPYEVVPWTNWPDRPGYPWSPSNGAGALRGHDSITWNPVLTGASEAEAYNPYTSVWNQPRYSDLAWPGLKNPPFNFVGVGEGNPLFGPGFGDTRWLRDLEPMSVDGFGLPEGETSGVLQRVQDGIPDSFRQWRHLSNIAAAENTWRVVLDISDVTGVRRVAGGFDPADPNNSLWPSLPIVSDLSIPVEQWLPNIPYGEVFDFNPNIDPSNRIGQTGTPQLFESDYASSDLLTPSFLETVWARWANQSFHPQHLSLVNGNSPPLNFFNLYDLNANGRRSEPGERLNDRFVGVRKSIEPGNWSAVPDNPNFPYGTPAWNISRFLDDADGDGFTDSFWYLPSSSPQNGILQVVSVSITDNAGRIDLSSGSRFSPGLQSLPPATPTGRNQLRTEVRERGTRGATPGDLALVSQIDASPRGPDHPVEPSGNRTTVAESKIGFFDIPEHGESWRQIPGVLREPAFTDIAWPISNDEEQPFGPLAATSPLPNDPPLVKQDFNGYHDPGSSLSGSWNNFLEASGWRRWFIEEFNQLPTIEDERNAFLTHKERLALWRDGAGLDNRRRLGLASELELRLIEGHNSSDTFTEAEYLLGSWRHKPFDGEFGGSHPLRAVSVATEEAQTFGGLLNGELRADLRHRVTTYSNTRNDLLPDWLRWKWDLAYDLDGDGLLDAPRVPSPGVTHQNFSWSLLLDANGNPYPLYGINQLPNPPNYWNGQWASAYKTLLDQFDRKIDLREANPTQLLGTHFTAGGLPTGNALLSRRLPYLLLNAISEGDENGSWFGSWGPSGSSYFGLTRDTISPGLESPGSYGENPNLLEYPQSPFVDLNFAQVELTAGGVTPAFGNSQVIPNGHSRLNANWLRLISSGWAANILSYRDDDWFTADPLDPTSPIIPRFRDVAPLFPDEAPNFPSVSQQAGLVPLPEWDRSPVRDPRDLYVDINTGQPIDPATLVDNPNAVVPVEGMLGLEMQPFLAEAGVVFLHAAKSAQVAVPGALNRAQAEALPGGGAFTYLDSQADAPYVDRESDHRAVVAVQLANPFDKPIPPEELAKYRLTVCGMHAPLAQCWLDAPGVQPPNSNNANSASLASLEPVTISRNPSAIFWIDPSGLAYNNPGWTPGLEIDPSSEPAIFKRNLLAWMGISAAQDADTIPSYAGEDPLPEIWGMTGTRRYAVPLLAAIPPSGTINTAAGWSTSRSAYERVDISDRPLRGPDANPREPQQPLDSLKYRFENGQRSIELSRIDNTASLLADPNLDSVNNNTGDDVPDGLVDIANFQDPDCVWVVVDRFDLGEGLDQTSIRSITGRDITQPPFDTADNQNVDNDRQDANADFSIKTNTFARMINRSLPRSNNTEDVIQDRVFGSIALTAPLNVDDPSQGPPPSEGSASGFGFEPGIPFNQFPTSVGIPLPATVEAPEPQATPTMYYQPGVFPPLTVTTADGSNPPFNSSGKNTFVQAFGVRRGWLVDTDANINVPESLGIQPSEFSLQFLSARQETTRLQSACRIFPRTSKVLDLVNAGIAEPLSGPNGLNGLYGERQGAPQAELRVFGSFINVNDDLSAVLPPIDAGPETLRAGQDRWGGPMRFGLPDYGRTTFVSSRGHVPSLRYTNAAGNQISLQDYIMTPFAFDGEFLSHSLARRSVDPNVPYPFVFSKSTRGSHSYENNSSVQTNLSSYSPGLTLIHKDDDFDQVGEILNIHLIGHHLRLVPLASADGSTTVAPLDTVGTNRTIPTVETVRTFSEFLAGIDRPLPRSLTSNIRSPDNFLAEDVTAQHLLLQTQAAGRLGLGRITGVPEPLSDQAFLGQSVRSASDFADPRHAQPDLPASSKVLDLFTCDGPGFNHDNQNFYPERSPGGDRFDLARGYSGRGTRGLLNINTSSVEAMRALPNWYKAIGVDAYTSEYTSSSDVSGAERFPRTWMAEAVASYRDGYANTSGTHGIPYGGRTFFDLRDSMHIVPDPMDINRPVSSDLVPHAYASLTEPQSLQRLPTLLNPNLSRSPDPSFPELHPYELRPDGDGATNSVQAEPARSNSPRGLRSIGELRQVDHRAVTITGGLGRIRPDVRVDGAPDFVRGWGDVFGASTFNQVEGTMSDLKSDSEAFSAFALAGTNAGSGPYWPFRQKARRSMSRPGLLSTDVSFTSTVEVPWADSAEIREYLNPNLAQGRYQSPFQRADYLLSESQTIQPSVTTPLDVSGNWSGILDSSFGNTLLYQDSAGGGIEDANLLVAGAGNLVTTRSDTFVAHFRVRSFKQNTETGIWDATDPRFIVDERRFVMLIDRSQVDEPGDQPDILFLEETPN